MPTKRFLISGRVQGVWFRAEAKRQADLLGVTGWVRNTPDGSVEVLAQADREVLQEFERWCQHGPPVAEVEKVQVWAIPDASTLSTFEIRYD